MPSRKKAKGQARKAAKVKKKEALMAEKVRELEESIRALEQSQIQRLQVNNALRNPAACLHGFDPFPNDDICSKFINTFVREFFKCYIKTVCEAHMIERPAIEALLKARGATKEEYSEVWNDASKMKQVISYFLYNGTMNILDEEDDSFNSAIIFARFHEQWLKVEVHKTQACIDWLKVVGSVGFGCDKHSRVKYFWRRIRCSCLDEKYEEVKSITKMGVCFNHDCAHPNRTVERSKLRCCSRCRSVAYCSRECQAADWSVHKEFCDAVAAMRAEFDARQQQQS